MKIERNLRSLVNSPVSNSGMKRMRAEAEGVLLFCLLGVTTIDKEGYLQFDPEKL